MSVFRTVKFTARTIDGVIQEFPETFNLICGQITPVGRQIVRNYNGNECILNVNVFLIYYGGQSLGSIDFETADQFIEYVNNGCNSGCAKEYLEMNGCYALVDGCALVV